MINMHSPRADVLDIIYFTRLEIHVLYSARPLSAARSALLIIRCLMIILSCGKAIVVQ